MGVGTVAPDFVAPMLAVAGRPPIGVGWAFEIKWDGVRCIAAVGGDQVGLHSRNANDITTGFPEIATLGELLDGRPTLLDGEIVALDNYGLPDFGLLQRRINVLAPRPELLATVPASFYAFDVLSVDGHSLLDEGYLRRREFLDALGLEGHSPRIRVPGNHVEIAGDELLEVARSHGLEGVVAKRTGSRYEPGRRSAEWTKTALLTTQEVIIGGWTAGEGRRASSLGSLLLGAHDEDGRLRYLGNVGTGFTERMLNELLTRLSELEQPHSPFDELVPLGEARRARWARPELVGEVQYRRLTHDGRLRHAAWRGLRIDKQPGQVVLGGSG